MGAIWLVFLAFPVAAAATAPHPLVWRVAGVVLILAFAVIYVHGFIQLGRTESWGEVESWGWRHLTVLVALALVVSLLIGLEALGMVTFVVAFGMFTLRLRWALTTGVLGILAATLVPLATGDLGETWFFVPIVALVAVATGLVRVLEQRQVQHQAVEAELTLAAERDRVARDVHDVLGHSLTVVTVKAELAQRLVDVDPERAKAELEQIRSLSREALAEIRATVSGLRVARLADEIEAARAALGDAGIEADLPDDPSVVDPRHRIVVAWVLREAVTNVVRHSRASRCTVTFDSTSVTVEDDGIGVRQRKEGNGLRGVRERVAGAGGTLTITAGPAGGTRLEVAL
jgi:two-component system sensor histidine kinase DesK